MNPQKCGWKNLYQITMRTMLQEEVTIHFNITIWYTNFPRPQAMKTPAAKAAVDKEWEKLEKYSGVGHDKSQKQIRGDR